MHILSCSYLSCREVLDVEKKLFGKKIYSLELYVLIIFTLFSIRFHNTKVK